MLSNEIHTALRELEARRGASNENAMRVAAEQIAGVRARGDAFVREQIEGFDNVTIDELLLTPREVSIDPAMRDARHISRSFGVRWRSSHRFGRAGETRCVATCDACESQASHAANPHDSTTLPKRRLCRAHSKVLRTKR